MNVNYFKTLWKSSLMILMLCFGLTSVWGQTYNLVTSAAQLEAGSEYIIAGTTTNNNLWIVSITQTNNNRTAVQNGTASSMPSSIEFSSNYASFILGTSGEKWTLYDADPTGSGTTNGGTSNGLGGNVGYLYPVSGQNYLRTQTTLHEWTISIDNSTSIATIQTTVNNRKIKLNTNGGLFSAYTSDQRDIYLYKKQASVPCNEGTLTAGATASNVTEVASGGTADLSLDEASTGTGLSYQWQSSANGADWSDIDGATNATYSATNITADTYFRAEVTCGTTTEISTPIQVSLTYCIPTYNNSGDSDKISNVTLGELNNSSGVATSAPYYTFYNSVTIPDIARGETIQVSVTFGSHGTQYSAIWIDFNQNYIFESSEGFVGPNAGSNGTYIYNILVPEDAILGETRMRIRGGDDSAITAFQACGASNSTWGETEDYIVNIVAGCTPAIYAFDSEVIDKDTDDEPFTNDFISDNNSSTVFASSNTAVATVNETTGEVTIVGVGSTTISVTQEADGNYCAVSASYELNVTTTEPLLVFAGNTDMGSTCFQGEAIEAEYTVTNNGGSTANNVVFLNTNPAFQVFPPVSPQNIAPGGFVTVNVTFNPMMGALPNTNNNTLTAMSNGTTLASHNITATVNMPISGDVATYAATSETETGVTFNGQITDLGTCWNVTEYGFVYATTPNPTNANFSIIAGSDPSFATPFQFTLGGVLTPGTTYYYKAYVKYSQGFADYYHYGNEESFITTLSTPTATAATNVSSNSFTANWNAVAGATSYEINVWTYETGGYATDLFISEYVEGSSNNKAIEIFNGTAATVNLNDYKVILYANGSTSATNTQVLGDLQATLLPGQTIVLRNSSLNVPGYISSVCNFNGDDAIGLYKGEDLIDVFGKIGDDPGNAWTGSNSYTTVDKTLRRKSSVTEGITTNPSGTGATAFTTLTTEWDMFNIDTYDGLGTHTFNGGSTQVFILQNENVGNVTSYEVTGLDSETTYKYTVKAQTADTATVSSNEITVTTLATPIVTWTIDNEWSNITGPTITDDAVIEGDLTLTENLSAKTLTVAVGGAITVPANTSLTVEGKITNNGEFTVESDGILYQNNFTGANEGNITVERDANPMKRLDYTLWSSPVSGMPLNQFSNISNNGGTGTIWNRVYELGADAWNSIWSSYAEASESTATFADAKGYLYRAFNSYDAVNTTIFTGEFTGVPNNGTKSISTPNAFDAVGNPYPSPINANDFINSNNADAIYFWTNVNSSNGTEYVHNNWASYTLLGGVGVAIGGDSENIDPDTVPEDDMHIQPGQGFVVYTEENSVSFNNSMRTATNGAFFRAMATERNRFWLNLSNEEVTFNQILVGYMDNATQGVDTGIDGKMFAYEGNALYSIIENSEDNYVIQGRSLPFTASDVVALGFRAVNAGSFTISLHNFDGLFADNQNIYLKDNFTQAVHNLKDGAYSFVSEEGVFNTRFEVVYQTTMSVENPVANNSNWVVYSQENGFQVQTQGFELKTVQVFDLLGRTVYTANAQGTTHNIPSLGAESVYIVKVTTTDNVVLSKKVK